MIQLALPQTAADASARRLAPSTIARLVAPGCELRRLLDSGAHTTRHDTAQSIGIVHALWIVNATLSSPSSACSKRVQVASGDSARAGAAGAGAARLAHRTR